jgi:hypothetical protein
MNMLNVITILLSMALIVQSHDDGIYTLHEDKE